MRRYRFVSATFHAGMFAEFSADNDRQARAHVVGLVPIWGRIVSLVDVTEQYARPSRSRAVTL